MRNSRIAQEGATNAWETMRLLTVISTGSVDGAQNSKVILLPALSLFMDSERASYAQFVAWKVTLVLNVLLFSLLYLLCLSVTEIFHADVEELIGVLLWEEEEGLSFWEDGEKEIEIIQLVVDIIK